MQRGDAHWSDWGIFAAGDRWVDRIREWDRRTKVIAIGAVASIVLLFVGLVPPLRFGATAAFVRILRFVAAPILPDVGGFDTLPQPSQVVAADGTPLAVVGDENRRRIPLEQIPDHVRHAVLAAEDSDFYRHPGIDSVAMMRAAWSTLTGDLAGGSTITQQLAKLNYTDGERTVGRKLRELLYAVQLEATHTKDDLLERYLNEVYFGDGAYGIDVAAETFFGVDAEDLDLPQAAMLAGKIRSPEPLDPHERPKEVRARRNSVLASMEKAGWIDAEEAADARRAPLEVVAPAPEEAASNGVAPHFVRFVRREAEQLDALGQSEDARRHQLYVRGGYRIHTSLETDDHRAAQRVVDGTFGESDGADAAVVSVVPGDGAVTVLVAGSDPSRKFDIATVGRRQAGSSFKPYAYLAMLRARLDPRSRFSAEAPATLSCNGEDWPVDNYGGFSGGLMTVDDALVRSVNVVFAHVVSRIGPEAVRDTAVDAGISPKAVDPPVCAMTLGGLREGVTALEQAAGFATFAAGGLYAEPYAITKISDRDGRVVYEKRPEPRRVFDETHTRILNAALQRVVTSGTGRAAAIGRPMAGKTGTTNDNADAWFVGFVPQLSTAVWVGHPERRVAMDSSVTGGSVAARIFRASMRSSVAGLRVIDIPTASADGLGLEILNPARTAAPESADPALDQSPSPTTATHSPVLTSPTRPPPYTARPAVRPSSRPSPSPTQPPRTTEPAPSPSERPASSNPDDGGGKNGGKGPK